MDSQTASFNEDLVVEVVVEGDLTRFIDPESRAMSAQLTWMPPPLVLLYPWSIRID